MEWKYIKGVDVALTTEDVAQIEKTSPAWVRRLIKHKLLQAQVRGGGYKVYVEDYLEYRRATKGYDLASEEDMIALSRLLHLS